MPSDDYLKKDLLEEWSSTPYIAGKEAGKERARQKKKKPVVPQEKPKKEKKQ